jgi:hypothetical protein
MPPVSTSTVEMVDGLATVVVDLNDLGPGDYVLLPCDAEEDDAPILVERTTPDPLLWRVADWPEDNEESGVVRFDGPDKGWFELPVEGLTLVRQVVPGQQDRHDTWS